MVIDHRRGAGFLLRGLRCGAPAERALRIRWVAHSRQRAARRDRREREFFGSEELHDGDLIPVNSASYGNTHLGDFALVTPVFYKGGHLFWSAATGHQMDVGSAYHTSVPTYATDIWSEGLLVLIFSLIAKQPRVASIQP